MSNPRKLQLFAATAVLLPLGVAGDLSFHPDEETVLGKEFTVDVGVELDDISLLVNGEDMSGMVELDGIEMEATLTALISDEYRKVGGGRPLELVRSFEEVSVEYDSGDEQGSESAEDLEGVSVVFVWDEESEKYNVSFAEDSEGEDEEILKGMLEDMDFRALLPDGEVDEGETWDVPPSAIASVLFPGMALKDLSAMAEEEADEIPEGLLDQLEGLQDGLEMSCTYAGTREEGGITVGVVQVVLEGDASLDLESVIGEAMELPAEADVSIETATVDLSLEGEGELLWNLAAGHMASYEMEGELEVEINVSAAVEAQGQSADIEGNVLFLGEITWEASLADE